MFADLLRKLTGRGSTVPAVSPETLDQVIAATDPRLALLPGYRKALLLGVQSTTAYCAGLSHLWPACLELSLRAFTTDRRVGLFFSSPASLLAALKRSTLLQDYFHQASNGDEAYALLLMHRTDRQRYGLANEGGEVHSGVAQTVVSFDNQHLILPCQSMQRLCDQTAARGVSVMTGVIARRIELLNKERAEIDSELMRIKLHLSALDHPSSVLIDAMPEDDALPADRKRLLERQETLSARQHYVKGMTELSGLLELVSHMLENPQDYFRLVPERLNIDRMGVLQSEGGAEGGAEVCMEELYVTPTEYVRRVVLPVKVNRLAMDELARLQD